MNWNYSPILLFLLFACNNSDIDQAKNIEWTGEALAGDIYLEPEFVFDSIQFSNGNYNYVLRGNLLIGSDKNEYSLLFEANPFSTKVLEAATQKFPLEISHSSKYNCIAYSFAKQLALEWKYGDKRLTFFLPHRFSEER